MDIKPTATHCKCNTCGTEFTIMSGIGKSTICDECAKPLLDILGTALTTKTNDFSEIGE